MANRFSFVGKIVPCKTTDSFKPYSVTTFDSGWAKTSIRFNVVCDTNRHLLESSCLTPKDIQSATIYTYTVSADSVGGKAEGKNVQIAYADRTDPLIIAQVPYYKKFIVDTEIPERRKELTNAVDKFKEGTITDEEMAKLGVKSLDECEAALEKSKKKRHEFIWEYDFVEYLNKFVNNEAIKDMKFHIKGEYVLDYSDKDKKWYKHLKPTSIYRCKEDEVVESTAEFVVVFDQNAIDDSDLEETGKIHLNCYTPQYLGKPYKGNRYAPMVFTINANKDDAKSVKLANRIAERFKFPDDYEGEYREYGIKVNLIDGAPVVELTMDNITDDQREDIECGLYTLEMLRSKMSKPVYGDKVQDLVIVGTNPNYNGSKETTLTADEVTVVRCDLEPAREPVAEKPELPFDEEDDDDII